MKKVTINPSPGTYINDAIELAWRISYDLVEWNIPCGWWDERQYIIAETPEEIGDLGSTFEVNLHHNSDIITFTVKNGILLTTLFDAMQQYYKPVILLTKNGILCRNRYKKMAFFSNDGYFRRECTFEEYLHIETMYLPTIIMSSWYNDLGNFIMGDMEIPVWHKIATFTVEDDYSRWKAGTSCNGGDYSFHIKQEWFASKLPNGEWKFCYVNSFSTSAEFSYDELNGSFQQDLGNLVVENCSEPISYRTRTRQEYDPAWLCYSPCNEYRVLEQISEKSTFANLWNATYSRIEQDDKDSYDCPALSLSYKKKIITQLKKLGMQRPEKRTKMRLRRL